MQVFDQTGTAWRLDPGMGSGGEGTVYRVPARPEWCVKIYHERPLGQAKILKVRALHGLASSLGGCTALPVGLAYAARGARDPVGVFVPYAEGHDIFELYNPQGRRAHFQGATFEFLVAAALNLSRVFEILHKAGVVVGDINEQNIKVRADATLTLIDCDGFQIRNGTEWLTSEVGTPMWTPPELQGVSLKGLVRTQNHDGFGLAQLIFLLLCAGRYPFAGRPIRDEMLSPEEAIGRYAFAFDPAPRAPVLEPPLGAPFFEALPGFLQTLFVRAFCEGSAEPGARPSAREWSEALESLRGELVRCGRWREHVYWRGASGCPWCEVLEMLGKDFFPGPALPVSLAQGVRAERSPEDTARRMLHLNFEPAPLGVPHETHLSEALSETPLPGDSMWMPLARGLGALGGKLIGQWANRLQARRAQAQAKADACRQRATELFIKYAGRAHTVLVQAREVGDLLTRWLEASAATPKAMERRERELAMRRYLEGFLLRRHAIQGVGPGRMALLLSNNIVTAADLNPEVLEALPGFGGALRERLLKWRADCEWGFRFSPTQSGTAAGCAGAQSEEARLELARLMQRARRCEEQLEKLHKAYNAEFTLLQNEFTEACTEKAVLLAQAKSLS